MMTWIRHQCPLCGRVQTVILEWMSVSPKSQQAQLQLILSAWFLGAVRLVTTVILVCPMVFCSLWVRNMDPRKT